MIAIRDDMVVVVGLGPSDQAEVPDWAGTRGGSFAQIAAKTI